MRINCSDDEEFPGQFGLWNANCERSILSRSGRKSLLELEAALLALPDKRLIAHDLVNEDGEVCAIGALAQYKNIHPKNDPDGDMDLVGVECGMPRLMAWKVVFLNDEQWDCYWTGNKRIPFTPEERYEGMLKWVRGKLASFDSQQKEGK